MSTVRLTFGIQGVAQDVAPFGLEANVSTEDVPFAFRQCRASDVQGMRRAGCRLQASETCLKWTDLGQPVGGEAVKQRKPARSALEDRAGLPAAFAAGKKLQCQQIQCRLQRLCGTNKAGRGKCGGHAKFMGEMQPIEEMQDGSVLCTSL
eukprot:363445-Chlamydomonas_euryale.AAC.3